MRAFLLALGLSVSVAGHALEIPHPESDRPGSEQEAPVDKSQDEVPTGESSHIRGHIELPADLALRHTLLNEHPAARFLTELDGRALRPAGIKLVSFGVKSFGHEFVEGSKAPDVWLDQAYLRSLHGPRLARWQDAPPEKRVFIIASAEDAASVHALQKNLEEKGFATFFYDNCNPLCASQVVGAFCSQAHSVVVMSTPESDRSSYVRAEIAKAREVKRLGPELVLMDPRDFLRSAAGLVAHAVSKGMQGEPSFAVRGLAYEAVPCDPAKPDCRR